MIRYITILLFLVVQLSAADDIELSLLDEVERAAYGEKNKYLRFKLNNLSTKDVSIELIKGNSAFDLDLAVGVEFFIIEGKSKWQLVYAHDSYGQSVQVKPATSHIISIPSFMLEDVRNKDLKLMIRLDGITSSVFQLR